MNVELELQGPDAAQSTVRALQDWVRRERIEGLRIEPRRRPPVEGQMGVDPTTILSVVLGSAAAVEMARELAKSLHIWLETRRPRLKIRVRLNGSEVEIDGQNLPEQQVVIDKVLALIAASGR
jgi:hypothetical protein